MKDQIHNSLPGYGATDRLADAVEIDRMPVTLCRQDFIAGLPVQETESVQLAPGTAEYRSRRIFGRDFVLLSYSLSPRIVIHTVPKRDWTVLIMPTNPRSDMTFNGRRSRPFELLLSTGTDGYTTIGKDRQNIAIAIRTTRLVSACAALAGVGEEDIGLNDLTVPREQVLAQQVHRALTGVAALPGESPLAEVQFSMSKALESDLISLLAAQLAPALRRSPEVNRFRIDALRVVRAAIDASKALPSPSLADLCAAAGVSQRWLHRCCMEVLGVSPYRYIRLARLSKAREALLASANTGDRAPLIKSLSLSLGYRLSGRFAADYRSVFGENPSDTLQRSCNP